MKLGKVMFNKKNDDLHQRSKERVALMGEVFTPESYVIDMLALLNSYEWSNERNIFFEPCCGRGNIVLPIIKKRLDSLHNKYSKTNTSNSALYAVAQTLNTLWAIDIDKTNIIECRERVFLLTLDFLCAHLDLTIKKLLVKQRNFITHVACAIVWHIDENETLSSICSNDTKEINARKTKAGQEWFESNNSVTLDFKNSWCNYFESCIANGKTPILYTNATKAIDQIVSGKKNKIQNFEHVNIIITNIKKYNN